MTIDGIAIRTMGLPHRSNPQNVPAPFFAWFDVDPRAELGVLRERFGALSGFRLDRILDLPLHGVFG